MKLIEFFLGILCLACVIIIAIFAKPEGNFEKFFSILLGGGMLVGGFIFLKKFTSQKM